MARFDNKSVLVTGGTSGIGLGSAQAFIDAGARVVFTGRDAGTLDRVQKQLGDRAIGLQNDSGRIADAQALAEQLTHRGIMLDAVFINAGAAKFGALADITEAQWDTSFDANVKGAFFQIQALAPLLNPGASIVLNGSINAHIGMPGSSVYAASKAALISLAKTLSAELLPRGIRVNVISPGPVWTPLHAQFGSEGNAQVQSRIPLGRFGKVEEIAATVLHLASPESGFIVGAEIIADGGMSTL
ncbi:MULTISPECIES: SDR family oxidoreductase [Hydrocarboniphaga]|uniref:Short-chain dehydrogenase/reductase SDR n=1 Tax=Hydrocarboniphaga effusa AP103 TaxID=1172194 RepID=I8TBD8_9GAMM|nr:MULTISPECIES: SDR family oxidoreductase [Hydrocarboniphaga]EIT71125.1 short-chain dehydrogenase/reductase SDR [Hydrocarboniphaga effusa AP103]MDZ4079515.1 SDR family oxidoreductase [Hydrocarboniphaga sp.]